MPPNAIRSPPGWSPETLVVDVLVVERYPPGPPRTLYSSNVTVLSFP